MLVPVDNEQIPLSDTPVLLGNESKPRPEVDDTGLEQRLISLEGNLQVEPRRGLEGSWKLEQGMHS